MSQSRQTKQVQQKLATRENRYPLSVPAVRGRTLDTKLGFAVFSILLLSTCFVVQELGRRHQVQQVFQRQSVPISLLEDGSLGKTLRESGWVKRVPIRSRGQDARAHNPDQAVNPDPQSPGFMFVTGPGPQGLGQLLISEVQPSNAGEVVDRDGHCPDWIELWNPSGHPFDVTGWYLTDDPQSLDKWEFPQMIVPAGSRFLVFASGKDSLDATELHTNFRLARTGDYLALVKPDGQTVQQAFQFGSPDNHHGLSYDTTSTSVLPLLSPTPGAENSAGARGFAPGVTYSHSSHLFQSEFWLTLSCQASRSLIRYTTDGSIPTETRGMTYRQPLKIDRTTVIRAVAFVPNQRPSAPATRSFLNIDSLVHQKAEPAGFPDRWNETVADYEMDPRIIARHEQELKAALESLPVISLVADREQLFGNRGIYAHTWERGFDWEIPAVMELLNESGQTGFQSSCGIRVAGNESRSEDWKKHSLRMNFRSRYGDGKLNYPLFKQAGVNQFSSLMLRSTDDSWVSHEQSIRENAQYIRDQWSRDTLHAMGQLTPRGRYVHVCLNGLYWGVYNLIERPNDEFLANQLGGKDSDYITIRTRIGVLEAEQVGIEAWTELAHLADRDLRVQENYEAITRRMDLVSFIDYCLVNMYAGGEDWALVNGNNLRAFRHKRPGSRIRFLAWDNDSTFASGWNNDSINYVLWVSDPEDPLSFQFIFDALVRNREFREMFRSRLHHWSRAGQPLHPLQARQRYEQLLNSVEPALLAESARWGDVHTPEPFTPGNHWATQKQRILEQWFTNRPAKIRQELEQYWSE